MKNNIETIRKEVEKNAKDEASKAIENKAYDRAINTLNKAITLLNSSDELENLRKEYEQEKSAYEQEKRIEQQEKEKERLLALSLIEGTSFETDHAEITVKKIGLVDHIYPDKRNAYYFYYTVNETGMTWFDVELKVKNTSTGVLNLYNLISGKEANYNGKYKITSCAKYYSTGSTIERLYEYWSNSIDSLHEATVHFVVEVPVEAKESGNSVYLNLDIDGVQKVVNYVSE